MKMNFTKLKEIENLAHQKEKEWKNVTSLQISSLQTALQQKENDFKDLNSKFLKLKDDFKYNLKLLQDRDKELKQYDESFAKTKTLESVHIAEISDFKIRIAKLTDSLEREQQSQCEMQRHYIQRLIDQQAELEAFKVAKEAEVEETLSQLSQIKSHHERLESQLRSEIESQKFELTSELEIALQKKDRENKENEDKIQSETMAVQLKCKLLEKELELVKSAQEKQQQTLQSADEAGSKLKKKLEAAEHDARDISALKNARILELEAKVQNLEAKNSSIVSDYEERRRQLDKDIRMKQTNMDSVRQNFFEKENSLEETIRKLQTKVEMSSHETRRALWDKNDLEKEKDVIIDKLRKEIQDINLRFDNQAKINSTAVVSKDVEIQNLRKREDLLKAELEKLKEDNGKYKRELASATQKENILLQSKVQLKMDWQQRCQEVEQKQYAKSEELIQSLTKSRDMAVAEVRKLRRKLGIDNDDLQDNHNASSLEHQMESLQAQNDQLKRIVEEMTSDMQKLAGDKGQNTDDDKNGSSDASKVNRSETNVSPEYVKSLEDELIVLRKEKRLLEEKAMVMKDLPESSEQAPPEIKASFDHPDVKSHIAHLNKSIGHLRVEKTDMSAQLQKVQVRLRHQDGLLTSRENDIKRQLGRIQELEYELSSNKRRSEQENLSLKRQISDLELQLAETRREADEYYRGGIQNNLHATELGNQLSQMTVNAAAKTPWMSEVAQSGVVKQLQLEITELRKELTKAKQAIIFGKDGRPNKAAAINRKLQDKLQLAAEHISRLLREKSQLLEVGNSLRAELALLKDKPQNTTEKAFKRREMVEKGDGDKVKNKLEQMEDLQYQLTKQELQYAQRTSPRKYQLPVQDVSSHPATSTPNETSPIPRLQETNSTVPGSNLKPLQYSLSSVGDASMKDIWKMLDQEPSSPSISGSKDAHGDVGLEHTPSRQPIRTIQAKESSRFGIQSHAKGKTNKTPKIRNYNIKDDKQARLTKNFGRRKF